MTHFMLDLETLGVGPNAAVVAIGACAFDPHKSGVDADKFYLRVTLADAMRYGQVDASTVKWWMGQSDAARNATFQGDASPLAWSLERFNAWLDRLCELKAKTEACVWGNGATFDNVVIRSAFKAVEIEPIWSFRNDKCYRTVVNLVPQDRRPPFVNVGVAHNALDDAVAQACYLQACHKALGL